MTHDPQPETPEADPAPDAPVVSPVALPTGDDTAAVETDEPPIIISGGSLSFEFPNGKNIQQFDETPGERPFKYRYSAGTAERALETVRVVTQLTNGNVSYPSGNPRVFPENQRCILKIWLQPLTLNGQNVVPSAITTEPDIQIQGAAAVGTGSPSVLIETRLPLLAEVHSHKQSRRHRNNYPTIASHFRIGRWQVVSEFNPAQELDGASQDDGYQLFVTFHTH